MDEQRIIRKVLDGNIDAYEQLVIRYQVGLIIYCDGFTHDRDAAEDIAQDSFIYAYKTLRRYRPARGQFSTWLYQIARSKALDYCRRRKITYDIDTLPDIEPLTASISAAERAEIRHAVEMLKPPIYRAVIEDYYWHGLSYEAIASKHNTPINTVRTHLRRAKATLKGVLS